MVYKCGPNKLIYSLSKIRAAELVEIKIELKIDIIQIIFNDFNGSNSLFSQIVSNFLVFSLVRFLGLNYPKTMLSGFVVTF